VGNIIWFIFCGFWQGLAWSFFGFLWSLTIVGIPIGIQCFKISHLYFMPFNKRVVYEGGAGSFLLNIFWIIFSGVPLTIAALINGILLCVTIVGIPFGLQCFKLAKLGFMPFGAKVVED